MERSNHEEHEYVVFMIIYHYMMMVGAVETDVKSPKLKITRVYQQIYNCFQTFIIK